MPHNAVALQNLNSPFRNYCKNNPGRCSSLNLQNLLCPSPDRLKELIFLQNLEQDGLQNLVRVKDGRVHTAQGAKIKFVSDALAKKANKNALQNLAWLDANGNVHTVQQPNDGTRLLGATNQYLI